MKDRARQVIIAILGFTLLYVLGKSVEYEVKAAQTDCVFCCSSNCDGANGGVVPTASPTPTPTPTPSPTPTPPPEGTATVDMVCSTYGLTSNRGSASGSDFTTADTIKANCKVVLTFWQQTSANNWCPYIMDNPAITQYCGPYENFGFMNGGDPAAETWNLGRQEYAYGGFHASCSSDNGNGANRDCGLILRDDDTATEVYNAWGNNLEKATDKGSYGDSTKFIDKWYAYHIDVQDSPSQLAAFTGTAATNNWNMFFLDNYQIWIHSDGGLSDLPIDPRRGGSYTRANMETDVISAMTYMRTLADTDNKKLFCNLDGDTDYHYFERGLTYRTWVSKCHFALLEQQGVGFDGNYVTESNWLRRINIVQDIAKNTDTIPVIDATNLGGQTNLWYHVAGMLLAKEPGKGMVYFQSNIPSGTNLDKLRTLDCGTPLEDYHVVINTYYERNWTGCKIIVNPKTVSTGSISLGATMTNLETGQQITSITLQPHKGAILVK